MSEAVAEQPAALPIGAIEGRPGVTVVTQENMNAYIEQELGPVNREGMDPEAEAAAEFEKIEQEKEAASAKAAEPKEGETDGNKVYFKGKWVGKHDFNYRLHLKTEEAKAESQGKIDAAAAEAKALREEREAIAKERDALKAKYEPPKSDVLGPEPQMDQFTSVPDFLKARDEWVADKTRKEDAAKAAGERQAKEAEAVAKSWQERQAAFMKETPDYAETIEASAVKVSDQVQQAIIESEVGPQILHHLAKNPEIAEKWADLTVARVLREFGKLEASLTKSESKETPKTTIAEISKAPAPITPLKGANPGSGLKMDAAGNWTGTYEEFKAAVNAGKIR